MEKGSGTMELLRVIVSEAPRESTLALFERLKSELSRLHKKQSATEVQSEELPHGTHITIRGKLPAFDLVHSGEQIYGIISNVLANYILDNEEMRLIRRILTKEFHYEEPREIEKIEGYCRQFLFHNEVVPLQGREANWSRKEKISRELTTYIQENTDLHLGGFLQFRLQDYMEELREVVEYALDEFQMDQQYQEFISLLKYFVYIQEAKIPVAHLIHRGGNEFVILNDQLKPIDTDKIDAMFSLEWLDQNANFEDIVVSTLVSVSPEQIHIHSEEPEQQMIQTIMQIFEKRVTVCNKCRLCQSYAGGKHKHDQLSP
jgi:putative sporulation protein YtxC